MDTDEHGCQVIVRNNQFARQVSVIQPMKSVCIRVHPWLKTFHLFSMRMLENQRGCEKRKLFDPDARAPIVRAWTIHPDS